MQRAATGLALLLIGVLAISGCANKNAKDGASKSKDTASRKDGKAADPFETAEDPPLNANTHFAAGRLAESQGEAGKAAAQYREALKLDPNHRDALFALGSVLTRARQITEAVPVWQKYIEVTNHAPAAYSNLALCYETGGQIDKAEQTYRACIARVPQDNTVRVNYGLMLARQNRLDDAAAQLATALKPAEVTYNLGRVFEEGGRVEQAKAYYRRALEQDPTLREPQLRLAKLK